MFRRNAHRATVNALLQPRHAGLALRTRETRPPVTLSSNTNLFCVILFTFGKCILIVIVSCCRIHPCRYVWQWVSFCTFFYPSPPPPRSVGRDRFLSFFSYWREIWLWQFLGGLRIAWGSTEAARRRGNFWRLLKCRFYSRNVKGGGGGRVLLSEAKGLGMKWFPCSLSCLGRADQACRTPAGKFRAETRKSREGFGQYSAVLQFVSRGVELINWDVLRHFVCSRCEMYCVCFAVTLCIISKSSNLHYALLAILFSRLLAFH